MDIQPSSISRSLQTRGKTYFEVFMKALSEYQEVELEVLEAQGAGFQHCGKVVTSIVGDLVDLASSDTKEN